MARTLVHFCQIGVSELVATIAAIDSIRVCRWGRKLRASYLDETPKELTRLLACALWNHVPKWRRW